ncbi:DUF6234 family protein [Streptomyces canus]|uniref:DUF6234 family protein n=1 Tax=Streptomyces canus TaxID=58343 RepID=UPI003F6AF041
MLLVEIPVAFLLGLASVIRGWGGADEQTVAPPMDWVPVLWLGGFTLGVLVIAVVFLRSAHPFAGAVQLLVAAAALIFTIAAWHNQYERAHPAPPPTRAGMPHAPTVLHTQPHELSRSLTDDHEEQAQIPSRSSNRS